MMTERYYYSVSEGALYKVTVVEYKNNIGETILIEELSRELIKKNISVPEAKKLIRRGVE